MTNYNQLCLYVRVHIKQSFFQRKILDIVFRIIGSLISSREN
jgi:hypothetical protein